MGRHASANSFVKTTCTENDKILLPDGITKVILNSRAAAKTQKPELQAFLEYMNGKKSNSDFIIELENKVNEIKQNDKRRRIKNAGCNSADTFYLEFALQTRRLSVRSTHTAKNFFGN